MAHMRWVAMVLLVVAIGPLLVCRDERPAVRFATFNIEDFPKDRRQIEGAFREIEALHVGFIAVQEIGKPEVFLREARRRLGGRWDFVHLDTRPIGETRQTPPTQV